MPAESKQTIHQRMAAILEQLPAIGKDARNTGLNFNFRSIDAILNELNPLLAKHGVFILPEVRSTHVEAKTKGYAAMVEVAYHFTADDGTEVVAIVGGEGHDFADKALSKAMTMALKTCLGQVFAISTEDDPDGDSVGTTPGPTPPRVRGAARATRAESPAPPSPPAAPEESTESLEQAQQDLFAQVQSLLPEELVGLKSWLEENGIPLDFTKHTAEQIEAVRKCMTDRNWEPY